VTSELVESIQPDVVILATGSEPVVPDIPGIRDRRVTTARDVLAESVKITDKNVVVCGGGMVGAETAELLAEQGNSVTVIEQFPYIAYDMELLHRKALVDSLREKGVVLLTERKLMGVAEGHVLVEPSRLAPGAFRPQSIQFESSRGNPPTDEKERFLADWVILALGTKPVRGLAESLEQSVDEVYTVGDCEEPRRILEAVYEGLLVACRI
jgi:NAD(P)H-nitrite reductase large subunit